MLLVRYRRYSTGLVTYTQSMIHRGLRVLRIACERTRIAINYCRVMAAMRIPRTRSSTRVQLYLLVGTTATATTGANQIQ